ncbi:uncharacterized protein LOC109611090 [Ooceraea biroi]|nr:uncharacterized protein LOC109611090 [Ooceraea biroi]XP_026828961.1 uncharacterized protein LOC109611090 [Ooceraea biroi]XP_026828969.1 uncharacterized protein LOC109611090 [Ooceraea biroi]
MKERFEQQNSEWLNSEFHIPIINTDINVKAPSETRIGCPSVEFNQKSKRSQRREVAEISAQCKHNPLRIIMAGRYAARQCGQKDLYIILRNLLKSFEHPKNNVKLLDLPASVIVKKTPEEGLAFILDNCLSKSVYANIRLASKSSGTDIWPSYNNVRDIKAQCRPSKEAITICENVAEVSVQALLNHTVKRIVDLQTELILATLQKSDCTEIEAVFICSWGFDGSTGHSMYQQRYQDAEDANDESLFATTLIPLQLSTSTGLILWNNRTPQSARYCRPIKLQFVKESRDVIVAQKFCIEQQIAKLQVFEIMLQNFSIKIHFSLFLTLIDGKVLNTLTDTKSMQTCPICHATPKQFNDLSNKMNGLFLPDPNSLQYGISPLHAWIRFFECCLHISYRVTIKKWQIRSDEDKLEFTKRKKHVQDLLWKKLSLKVDVPMSGGSGTSNNGNVARRAFEDADLFAHCLGLDSELIRKFKIILIALSCHLPLDPIRFDDLCSSTSELYVASYAWYPMPSTVHKILIYGAQIISTSILPVEILGEEASEARNKNCKRYRECHSRKHSRLANMEDMFYRVMDTSDPIISNISLNNRLNKQKRLPFSQDVIRLFLIPKIDETIHPDSEELEDCTGFNEIISVLDEAVLSTEE